MSDLLNRVADAKARAIEDYRTILSRRKSPEDGDGARLAAIIVSLGLTETDVRSDIAVLDELDALRANWVDPAGLPPLRAAVDQTCRELNAAEKQWHTVDFPRLSAAKIGALNSYNNFVYLLETQDKQNYEIARDNPRLFAGEKS